MPGALHAEKGIFTRPAGVTKKNEKLLKAFYLGARCVVHPLCWQWPLLADIYLARTANSVCIKIIINKRLSL